MDPLHILSLMVVISQVLADAEPVGEAEAKTKPEPEPDPQLAGFVPILQQRQGNSQIYPSDLGYGYDSLGSRNRIPFYQPQRRVLLGDNFGDQGLDLSGGVILGSTQPQTFTQLSFAPVVGGLYPSAANGQGLADQYPRDGQVPNYLLPTNFGIDGRYPGVDNRYPGIDGRYPGADNRYPGIENRYPGGSRLRPNTPDSTFDNYPTSPFNGGQRPSYYDNFYNDSKRRPTSIDNFYQQQRYN